MAGRMLKKSKIWGQADIPVFPFSSPFVGDAQPNPELQAILLMPTHFLILGNDF
jgi:hypothetical protein